MNIKKLLLGIFVVTSLAGVSPLATAHPPPPPIGGDDFGSPFQSFIGQYNGTYYNFSITLANPSKSSTDTYLNTTYMPWYGSGNSGSYGEDAMLAAALSYVSPSLFNQWYSGNFTGDQISIYALDSHSGSNGTVYYKGFNSGLYGNLTKSFLSNAFFLTATPVTGGATPVNNAPLDGYILPTANYFYSTGPFGGVAPEMNASLIPQIALMLACLFLLFGRKKENEDSMQTA